MYAPIGLFGKHPGYGDFLRAGLSEQIVETFSGWLDLSLSSLRDQLGGDWAEFWDNSQDLRFWMGRGVMGKTLAGVLRPSRDRVGRRYPLVMMAEGAALLPPLSIADQDFYEAMSRHLDQATPGQGAIALLGDVPFEVLAEPAEIAAPGPMVWAHHSTADLESLLPGVAAAEAERAGTGRVHFWAPGDEARVAVWLASQGLPGVGNMALLLAGVSSENSGDAAAEF